MLQESHTGAERSVYYRDEIENVYFLSDAHVFLKSWGWIFCSFRARHCRTQFNWERERKESNTGNRRVNSWSNHTASCTREHRSKWDYYYYYYYYYYFTFSMRKTKVHWLQICRRQTDEHCRFGECSRELYESGWSCKRVKRPLNLQRGCVIFDGINTAGFVSGTFPVNQKTTLVLVGHWGVWLLWPWGVRLMLANVCKLTEIQKVAVGPGQQYSGLSAAECL